MSTRREAREHAFTLCYELDLRELSPDDLLAELPVAPDPYAEALIRGVGENRKSLDEQVDAAAEHWTVERMAVVDRTLLRMGAFELAHHLDVPVAVIIDQAVELAKRYSTEESGRFVNGVLARLARDLRPETHAAPS